MIDKQKMKYLWGLVLLTFGLSMLSLAAAMTVIYNERDLQSAAVDKIDLAQLWEKELKVGEYVSIVDEQTGQVVDKMSRLVYKGDKIISENNHEYEVIKVTDDKATARKLGKAAGVVWQPEWDKYAVNQAKANSVPAQGDDKAQIAMYFTHTDESYVPTDGTESIPGKGGIIKVGRVLADALRKHGVSVALDATPHEPHDSAAYHRSRRTAVQLLKKQPIALIDVHRDGVPDPDFYQDKIQGADITKVRLVVGRQNPHMATNLDFAKKVKAFIDKEKPGLIKGIFIGKGNYNQDMGPKAMLIEVGTHTNSRYFAQNGAELFADALPKVLNLQQQQAPGGITNPLAENEAGNRTGWTTLAWILGIVLIGAAVFLFISTGSIQGMKSKLGEIRKTEFANYLGDGKTKKESKITRDKEDQGPGKKS